MRELSRFLKSFAASEGGATAIEYGLICSLIVVVILGAVGQVAGATVVMYALLQAAMGSL